MTDNKQRISELKGVIEQRRVQRSMAGLADAAAAAQAAHHPDSVEESAKAQIEQVSCAHNRTTTEASAKLGVAALECKGAKLLIYRWNSCLGVSLTACVYFCCACLMVNGPLGHWC